MDEPVGALDFKRKQEIRRFSVVCIQELSIPKYCTSPTLSRSSPQLADHLVILADGRSLASRPLSENAEPSRRYRWQDRDAATVWPVTCLRTRNALSSHRVPLRGTLSLPMRPDAQIGTPLRVQNSHAMTASP